MKRGGDGRKEGGEEGRGRKRANTARPLKNRMPISEKERVLQPSIQTGAQRGQLKSSQSLSAQSHNAPKLVT